MKSILSGINWKVRLGNKDFWLAFFPAFLLMIQTIAAPFGYNWDFVVLNEQIAAIVNSVFAVLALCGIVNDPTTKGFKDSTTAMMYSKPNQ